MKVYKIGCVVGVSFEDGLGLEVGFGNGGVVVVWVVFVEVDWVVKDKCVEGVVWGGGGFGEYGGCEVVGGVGVVVIEDGMLLFVEVGVVGGVEEECVVFEGVVGMGSVGCYCCFVVVLEVGVDIRKIDEDGDVERFEFVFGVNVREFEKLGWVVGVVGENDFFWGVGRFGGFFGFSG